MSSDRLNVAVVVFVWPGLLGHRRGNAADLMDQALRIERSLKTPCEALDLMRWCRDGGGWLAAFEDGAQAAIASVDAMASARAHGERSIAVGLGCGEVVIDGSWWIGADLGRARALALGSLHGDVLTTEHFGRQEKIPEGLGLFKGPLADQERIGFPFFALRDYR